MPFSDVMDTPQKRDAYFARIDAAQADQAAPQRAFQPQDFLASLGYQRSPNSGQMVRAGSDGVLRPFGMPDQEPDFMAPYRGGGRFGIPEGKARMMAGQDAMNWRQNQQANIAAQAGMLNHLQGLKMQGDTAVQIRGMKDPDMDQKFIDARLMTGNADTLPADLQARSIAKALSGVDKAAVGVGPRAAVAGGGAAQPNSRQELESMLGAATERRDAVPSEDAYKEMMKRIYAKKGEGDFNGIEELASALIGNDKINKSPDAIRTLIQKMNDRGGMPDSNNFAKDLDMAIIHHALEGNRGARFPTEDIRAGEHTIRPGKMPVSLFGIPSPIKRQTYQLIGDGQATAPTYSSSLPSAFHDLTPEWTDAGRAERAKKAEVLSRFTTEWKKLQQAGGR